MCPDHRNQIPQHNGQKGQVPPAIKDHGNRKGWIGKTIHTYTLEGIQKEKKFTRKMSLIDVRTPKKHITIRAAIKRGNMKVSTLTK